jgi:hypothetical protein
MLINKMGIEDDDVVHLDSRRVDAKVNPKNRVTMTMLLKAALNTIPQSELLATPPRTSVPISTLEIPSIGSTMTENTSHHDAA